MTVEPTRVDLEREIRKWVADGSDIDSENVLPGQQDIPRSDGVFASVLLIDDEEQSLPIEVDFPTLTHHHLDVRLVRRAMYSVQWYREGAVAAADRFQLWANSSLGTMAAQEAGFALDEIHLRQLNEPISQAWEERAQADVTLDYFQDARYDGDYVEETGDGSVTLEAAGEITTEDI